MTYSRSIKLALSGSMLTLVLLGASATPAEAAEVDIQPPNVIMGDAVGPSCIQGPTVSVEIAAADGSAEGIVVTGPVIEFGQGKGTGAPTVQLPAVQLPAVDPTNPPVIDPSDPNDP